MIFNKFSRALYFILAFVLFSTHCAPAVNALHPDDKKAVDSGARYVNAQDDCTSQASADTVGITPTSGSFDENVDVVFQYLTSRGLTPAQTIGMLVNLNWESGVEPTKVQGGALSKTMPMDNVTGWGIAQWTVIDRKQALVRYANKLKLETYDINFQARNLWRELSSNSNYGLSELKQTSSIEDAARVVLRKFERPKDQSEAHLQVRINEENAQKIINKYKDAAPAASPASSPTSSGGCVCSADTNSTVDNGKVVVLDPGHSINKAVVDSKTGLNDVDSSNEAERAAVWDVARAVKNKLEDDGYKVYLTKSSEDEYQGMRDRAKFADEKKAAIAVSIHGDPGLGNDGEIYVQKDGLYRGSGSDKLTFDNAELSKKSQDYAESFKSTREKAEGGTVVIKDNSFNGRAPIEPGNIPLVMLFSQSTPWVYNEAKMPFDNDKYAKGLIDGIEKALGSSNGTTKAADEPCSGGAGNGDAIAQAFGYAYSDGRKTLTMKESYALAVTTAKRNGEYIGGIDYPGVDCGGFVTRVMRNSGADKDYNKYEGPTSMQKKYMDDNPDKYEKVGEVNSVSRLQPGDIAVTSNHTFMYVGPESEHPDFKGNAASASLDDYAPTANTTYFVDSKGISFTWYRLKK